MTPIPPTPPPPTPEEEVAFLRGVVLDYNRRLNRASLQAHTFFEALLQFYESDPANYLREMRLAAGLSQSALARRVGVKRGVVSHFETGYTDQPLQFLELASTATRAFLEAKEAS